MGQCNDFLNNDKYNNKAEAKPFELYELKGKKTNLIKSFFFSSPKRRRS
jgi:hypothetical protein